MIELSPAGIATLGGLAGGIVLGFAARWGRFCTFGAIEDKILGDDGTRLRMWGLAIAVAIAGVYGMHMLGWINVGDSMYLASPVSITATIIGGLMFGLGMSLVGTCGFGVMSRIGGGDLKSIVTFLVMGISAFATMNGITAYLRVWLFPSPGQSEVSGSIARMIGALVPIDPNILAIGIAVILAVSVLLNGALLRHMRFFSTAILVGLVVIFGWWVTGVASVDPFDPQAPGSFTFAAPLGDTIFYVMTSTGSQPDFGIGAVFGIIIGAFLTTLVLRDFRWEACEDAIELRRQMLGGMLMGSGGILALGCTVGQGLSAASALALSAPVALVSMYIGSWFGLQFLISGSWWTPVRSLFFLQDK